MRIILGMACAAVCCLTACGPPGRPRQQVSPQQVLAGRRECPHDWNWDSLWAGKHWPRLQTPKPYLEVTDQLQNVPELNDCQRFIVPDRWNPAVLEYDSLFAIFAAASRLPREGPLVARGAVPAPTDSALAAAEIYAEGSYPPLHIQPMLNCLFMAGEGLTWRAKILPVGPVDRKCGGAVDLDTLGQGYELEVRAATAGSEFEDDDYPAVARWDWDDEHRWQYIGVKCGAAWCEVGPPRFTSSPGHAALAAGAPQGVDPRQYRRTRLIKGWYDEQYLAVPANNSLGVRPSGIYATVFPDPRIDAYSDADFQPTAASGANPWLLGAAITFTGGTQAERTTYLRKFGLGMAAASGLSNVIGICNGTEAGCLPAAVQTVLKADADYQKCDHRGWWGRVGGPDGRYVCVTRCAIPGIDVVGTARWRWTRHDEGVWMRCAQGCCEVIGPGG